MSGPRAGQGRAGRACRDAGKEGDGTLLYERDDGQGAGCSRGGAPPRVLYAWKQGSWGALSTTGPLRARWQGHGHSRAARAQRGRLFLGQASRLPDATIGSRGGCRCNSEVVPEGPEVPELQVLAKTEWLQIGANLRLQCTLLIALPKTQPASSGAMYSMAVTSLCDNVLSQCPSRSRLEQNQCSSERVRESLQMVSPTEPALVFPLRHCCSCSHPSRPACPHQDGSVSPGSGLSHFIAPHSRVCLMSDSLIPPTAIRTDAQLVTTRPWQPRQRATTGPARDGGSPLACISRLHRDLPCPVSGPAKSVSVSRPLLLLVLPLPALHSRLQLRHPLSPPPPLPRPA